MSDVHDALFAGTFYPGNASELKKDIAAFIGREKIEKKEALACVLPHAGYIYSGLVAARTVSRIKIKEKVVLLGPNHTGTGAPFSIMAKGFWRTPLGEIEIDSGLAEEILKNTPRIKDDPSAHRGEHSLEVELPLLQYFQSSFKIVPIAFLSSDINALKEIGDDIGKTLVGKPALIVASSDMTHYEPQKEAVYKDGEAIKAIIELNEDKLIKKIQSLNITMCGYAPVIVMLRAAKALGAKKAELIKYQTSAASTGDEESVVGYAGIAIY